MLVKVGDLVKWYELFADDTIVKDAGTGIIMKIKNIILNKLFSCRIAIIQLITQEK